MVLSGLGDCDNENYATLLLISAHLMSHELKRVEELRGYSVLKFLISPLPPKQSWTHSCCVVSHHANYVYARWLNVAMPHGALKRSMV